MSPQSLVETVHASPHPSPKRARGELTPAAGRASVTTSNFEPQGSPVPSAQKPSYLIIIPLEVLSAILSEVPSPKDVLAVARCSKHLCATLLNGSNQFIWRIAREQCLVGPIPHPPPGWSEAAYASFIFDEGPCEACQNNTKRLYTSFALKLRFCSNPACRNIAMRSVIRIDTLKSDKGHILRWIPRSEVHSWFDQNPRGAICRKDEWEAAVDEYNKHIRMGGSLEEYDSLHDKEAKLLLRKIDHHAALYELRAKWETAYIANRRDNVKMAIKFAAKEGWEESTLLETATYGSLHSSRNNCLEPVTDTEFDLSRLRISQEMLAIMEKRNRQQSERSAQKRRDDIDQHHRRLKLSGTYAILPSLFDFRKLPVIKLFQAKDTETLEAELKEKVIADLLRDDLKKWVEAAKDALGTVLGFPQWKNPSKTVLHPVDRVTAQFICTRCGGLPRTRLEEGSLDFKSACTHECTNMSRAEKNRRTWSAAHFVPDQKAINSIVQVLAMTGLNDEQSKTHGSLIAMGPCFQCRSCDAPIVMSFERLVGHSKRHEMMQVGILSQAEAGAILMHPYVPGLYVKMFGFSPAAKEARPTKTFGCRHCPQKAALAEAAPSHALDHRSHRTASLYTFDGLISHMKAKHKIERMGDEDFYRVLPIN